MNALLVMSLANLKATETIDVVRKAFFADCIDLTLQGDVEDVEIAMGLRVVRDTPPPDVSLIPGLPRLDLDNDGDEGLGDFPTGTFTNPFQQIGRNDPCPCGSGKKFKKCCLH